MCLFALYILHYVMCAYIFVLSIISLSFPLYSTIYRVSIKFLLCRIWSYSDNLHSPCMQYYIRTCIEHALEVSSLRGAKQIHVYLYVYLET